MFLHIWTFFSLILRKYNQVKQINIFSDGGSSQFKQCFLFSNLHTWEIEFNEKLNGIFLPHPYDGIGVTVKRSIWRAVKTDKNHVSDVSEYASIAKEQDSNINIEFISSNEIEEKTQYLSSIWENVLAVPCALKLHCVEGCKMNEISVSETSDGDFNVINIYPALEIDDDSDIISTNGDEINIRVDDKSSINFFIEY